MITVISGTNRSGNVSIKVAESVLELLTTNEIDAQILDLQKLPEDFVFRNDVFGNPDPGFSAISEQFIATADRFVFVIPEYNGSFPGVCKAFIDGVWPEHFKGKKASVIGLSSGRSGNLRGTDQLTNVLNYLEVVVVPLKVNIMYVDGQLDDNRNLINDKTRESIHKQLRLLVDL
jgi:chromate reductase, NAD(P)H dehydrogenase (quinone)